MSKLYKIKFNGSKEKIRFPGDEVVMKDGVAVGVKVVEGTRKELEVKILETLLRLAMNSQSDMTEMFKCKDCLDQVQNVDGEGFIKFEKGDIEYLKAGFTKTVDGRPDVWMKECFDLFKQIDNPEEEEIKKK